MFDDQIENWPIGTPQGRWAGFGPYYAMFPVKFARQIISEYSSVGDTVIDPFCGRGTTNYVSQILGRNSFGCELNPVGWLYAKAKTKPARQLGRVLRRIEETAEAKSSEDICPANEFQEWAWCPEVLGFINSARRNLNWRSSIVDRTVASLLLVYLHAKIGGGLSNQMRQSKSMSPDYAVRWWKERDMRPPPLDPCLFLKSRAEWRYAKGFNTVVGRSRLYFGDARVGLKRYDGDLASLVLTSPPYLGVTNYQYDNWIRLWALGGPELPDWSQKQRYANKEKYEALIGEVFSALAGKSRSDAVIAVRTDARQFTLETTAYAMDREWPQHRLFGRRSKADRPTQTTLFGDKSEKPGEIDLIALPKTKTPPAGFIDVASGVVVS
ncbi:DNA methyltransferase [Ruegeria sp. 2205SS24-7]|uniref:DNA methyltransferase n=1 Tax=Ruegeria discodermiae TaxID=3064389 RepID=UPI0027411380|nr:DNA methyltransferase [Ruegeria sp. 2205SS24-7]MDP5219313.1 DNA methyltransferase [Ruegeria sp. 2205SS24-7]